MAVTSKVYDRIWLAEYFHSFPHRNLNFKKVNSTFNPENEDYQESLVFLLLVPFTVSLVLWLVYIIYFIARCQKQTIHQRPKQRGSCCFSSFVFLFVLFAYCLIGFGLFQNEHVDDGVNGVKDALTNINNTISVAKEDLRNLEATADTVTGPLALTLEAAAGAIPDATFRRDVVDMIEQMRQQAAKAKGYMKVIDHIDTGQDYLTDVHDSVKEYEYYRWLGTVCVFVIYTSVFVCVLIGVMKHWKKMLIITAVFGALLAVLFWAFLGTYLGLSVGLGDFCMDPTQFFVKQLTGSESAGELLVYMKCEDTSQPYQQVITEAQNSLTQASNTLDAVAQYTRPYQLPGLFSLFEATVRLVSADILQAQRSLSSILTNVGTCTVLHNFYINGVNSACHKILESVSLLLLVAGLLALLSATMVFFVSCLWRTYDKRPTTQSMDADDTDPFLPRPPPYEHDYGSFARSSPAAWSDRGPLRAQHPSVNEEQVMFMRHQPTPLREDSPPPAMIALHKITPQIQVYSALYSGTHLQSHIAYTP
ncbi:hypothetical protein EGW08_019899 [Elysia chlorotica]|uniref:Protein tweety homolog n=1 Tax=Elysia chlorotica TaxID=188477 RepID=A0A3S1AZK0_ELYCH|nr:hypothetical protein EGW08_019899 [Elysia chlorotica]